MRTGADALIEASVASGIDTCFANPGTTELHLVQALDRSDMRTVLCAFEGVCSGAADGFARMSGRPALGLFHLGPGFANSLANQHNARRHQTPMINIIGDQATWHLPVDAPLTSDIDALTGWTGTTFRARSADDLPKLLIEAVAVAQRGPSHIANIIVPADTAWSSTSALAAVPVPTPPEPVIDADLVEQAARMIGEPGAILIAGGTELTSSGLDALGRIRHATGCRVAVTRTSKMASGSGLPAFDELPYFPGPLLGTLADVSSAVVVGRPVPVTFFGYPETPSAALPPSAPTLVIDEDGVDPSAVLLALADQLGADQAEPLAPEPISEVAAGPLTPANLGQAFARAIPSGAIVANEAITSGAGFRALGPRAEPHTLLSTLGGAIGGGLPSAVGAAVACPDRPVLALQADGSALYTIQSLWTMAREGLDVTTVVCANRSYKILEIELANAGMSLGAQGASLVDLSGPAVSFVDLASGFGVPGRAVTTAEELVDSLALAAREPGPYLIEAVLT